MEAKKKFSYKTKLAKLEEIQGALSAIRNYMAELNENEGRSRDPSYGDFYGIAVHLTALEEDVDSLYHEVEPMAFFEKKSA